MDLAVAAIIKAENSRPPTRRWTPRCRSWPTSTAWIWSTVKKYLPGRLRSGEGHCREKAVKLVADTRRGQEKPAEKRQEKKAKHKAEETAE